MTSYPEELKPRQLEGPMARQMSNEQMRKRIEELEAEILARNHAEKDLQGELRKFHSLYDLAVAMTSEHSMDDNLQLIVEKSRMILCSDISHISLYDTERREFYKHRSSGIRTEAYRRMRIPWDRGLGGMVARTRAGAIVEDYFSDERLDAPMRGIVSEEGIVSGMAVPVQMGAKILGVLYVFNRVKTSYSQSDLDTLLLIGNLAAVEVMRKQSEDALRESEERFRFMAETTGDVIYRLRYDSMTYDYLSPGIEGLTGYSAEDFKSMSFSKLVVRIDLPGQESVSPTEIVRERLEGKTGEYRADYLIRTRARDLKWLRDHSFPWVDESGKVVGSVGILSDISDYKRAEALVKERTADLIESEEKYRSLVENVPLVVYRMKQDGEILFVNQFVEEVFGYGPVEMLSNPVLWQESLYGEDRGRIGELRWQCCQEGNDFIAEYRVVHKSGHIVYVIDHAIPLRDSCGATRSMDGIIMDVTGRVKLQEDLIRTEGLKTIGEVSARLAHEIRNPLVSAGGFARRLLSAMDPADPNRPKVEIILKEVGRLELILHMILNYIRPVELEKSPTDLNDLIEGVLHAIQEADYGKHARFDLRLTTGLPDIEVDRLQMRRVLDSLIRNALNQMPQGGALSIESSCKGASFDLDFRYPVLHMSADDVEHFFYPFTTFQTAQSIVDLPMCKILVDKHGGAIDVRLEGESALWIHLSLPL
jgi:PAS domain S-box-containing protein